MKKQFNLLALLLAACFLALLAPQSAFASVNNCRSGQLPWSPAVSANVKSSTATGSAVTGTDAFNTITINCSNKWTADGNGTKCGSASNWSLVPYGNPITTTAYPGVYTTASMPAGLGYQLLNADGNPLPIVAGRFDTGSPPKTGNSTVQVHFRLVKIADTIDNASFSIPMDLSCTSNEWANKDEAGSKVTFNVTSAALTQTCNMLVSDLQVSMPLVNTTNFTGVGSAAGSKSSVLEFQCDANANAKVNFTDATDPSNAGNTLKLLSGSSATGVGIRLTVDGTDITLSPNEVFHNGGTELVLQNTGATAAVKQIPFNAQYVQTGSSVTPGTVQAQSLVNISYN